MGNIGATEIIIVLIIVLLIFGPKRVPELGRSLGRGLREFKSSVTGENSDDDEPPRQLGSAGESGDTTTSVPTGEESSQKSTTGS